ncbi:Pentatricopeptide repeat-containing protein [Ananas comosus]|uniref:Pentatricopeptide repeat-containing protein n=2 Tax=Ananas comosus TaxID=4615 RepID=A0A199VUB1_ANACO|nr:Pentatricopeptide repeat-containing protein [Ananas comosus]
MGKCGVHPNQVLIRTLLNGLCAGGRVDGAYDLIENVVGAGTISSDSCYSLLVTCLIKIHSLDEAEGLLRKMIEKGIKPSGLAFNSLVRELCRKGRILDGYSLLGVMEENESADSDVYSMLLKRLCEEGYMNEATMVGRKIVEGNIHVEADCVERAAEVLRKVGEEELASNILELKELQVVPF